jgi:hypothetical protein
MKIAVVIACAVVAFALLVFAIDRFILSPAPAAAPIRAK